MELITTTPNVTSRGIKITLRHWCYFIYNYLKLFFCLCLTLPGVEPGTFRLEVQRLITWANRRDIDEYSHTTSQTLSWRVERLAALYNNLLYAMSVKDKIIWVIHRNLGKYLNLRWQNYYLECNNDILHASNKLYQNRRILFIFTRSAVDSS